MKFKQECITMERRDDGTQHLTWKQRTDPGYTGPLLSY